MKFSAFATPASSSPAARRASTRIARRAHRTASRSGTRCSAASGFTMTELVIALGVIAILAIVIIGMSLSRSRSDVGRYQIQVIQEREPIRDYIVIKCDTVSGDVYAIRGNGTTAQEHWQTLR